MISKEEYVQKLELQLNEWNSKIRELQNIYQDDVIRNSNNSHGFIESVWKKYDTVKGKLEEIRTSRDGEWRNIMENTNESWHDLKLSYLSAVLKIK